MLGELPTPRLTTASFFSRARCQRQPETLPIVFLRTGKPTLLRWESKSRAVHSRSGWFWQTSITLLLSVWGRPRSAPWSGAVVDSSRPPILASTSPGKSPASYLSRRDRSALTCSLSRLYLCSAAASNSSMSSLVSLIVMHPILTQSLELRGRWVPKETEWDENCSSALID